MENNEELALEVIETTEEIVNTSSKQNAIKTTAGVGLVVLGGIATYKYVYKPIKAKRKAKKEQKTINEDVIIDDEIVSDESTFDEEIEEE